ncbi:MAG: CDP-diacylglycerol/serine O-phosphatidyltransferase [Parcubacteria group bacterium GW2011_GWA1_38_7]|nr:MAG: CDP-diacylglycerol/serine O-phosphatidyltransferase [Parcubacteria group bacterium GW2011_GWA1_38_7]
MKDMIRSNVPNIVSGIALLFCWLAIIFVIKGLFYASFGFILLAFVFDALDGYLARSLGLDNKFGRALDGYIDVVNYLVYPAIAFFVFFHLTNFISLLAIFIFFGCGIFRLARFQIRGIKTQENKMYYEGLPVFISPIIILFFLFIYQFSSKGTFTVIASGTLILIGIFMVLLFKFPKPKKVFPILLIATASSFVFFAKQFNFL